MTTADDVRRVGLALPRAYEREIHGRWKLKVGPEDGRLEVEGEVDSNRNGQTWRWSILHNGSLSASGTRTTRAPSGSFEVRRTVVNLRGTDTLTFRARNPRTGEQCRGIVRR